MLQIMALVVLTVWAIIQNLLYMNFLPERVAIHFDAQGVADNWASRSQATLLMIALQGLLPWFMVAVAYGIRYMPASLVNIPHREYWLAADRRGPTLRYVAKLLLSIAIAESLLISAVNHLSFVANRNGQPLNTPLFLVVLGMFLAVTIFMVVKMYRRFAMPRNSQPLAG